MEGEKKHNNPLWKVGYAEKCRAVQIVASPRTKYAISECVGREEHCQTLAHFSAQGLKFFMSPIDRLLRPGVLTR